jgi:hypothetical protein
MADPAAELREPDPRRKASALAGIAARAAAGLDDPARLFPHIVQVCRPLCSPMTV